MCGIAGIYVKERFIGDFPIDAFADHLMLGIENRGRHATGFMSASKSGKRLVLDKAPLPAHEFIQDRNRIHAQSKLALLHTRYATQGSPDENSNNHPVVFRSCFAVHNGVIQNDKNIFDDLQVQRTAEVDSQAIAALLAECDLNDEAAIKEQLRKLKGSFAIAVHDPDRNPNKLVLAKGDGSPLIILNHPMALIWASERQAIERAWEATVGTVTKKLCKYGEDIGTQTGFKWFSAGDLLILDNDRINEERFTVNRESSYFRNNHQRSMHEYGEWDDYFAGVEGTVRTGPRIWTCKPAVEGQAESKYQACAHPCKPGCVGGKCECYEGNPNHPRVPGSVNTVNRTSVRGNTEEEARLAYLELAPDGTADVTLVQCWACDTFVLDADITDLYLHDMGTKQICLDCAEIEETFDDPLATYLDRRESGDPLGSCPASTTGPTEGRADSKDYAKIAAEENVLHKQAIKELAFEIQERPEFLDWLLFRCPLELLDKNKDLADQRDIVEYEYENAKAVVMATWFRNKVRSGNLDCARLGCKTGMQIGRQNPHKPGQTMFVCENCKDAHDIWSKLIKDGASAVREGAK